MSTTRTITTADDLLEMPDDGFRYELVEGELKRMAPAGSEHGSIGANLTIGLGYFVKANGLGTVFNSETGFRISSNPDTVLSPDVAFVRRERIPEGGMPTGFWSGAPDLAVEVISPNDRYTEVEEKVTVWLNAGARMVIVINPRTRTVTVYNSPTEIARLTESDILSGGEVVLGFECRVSELFETL